MRFYVTLIIFFLCYSINIYGRPTQLEEENNSETNEGEYENDDSADDEYLHEDEQSAIEEAPQKANNRDDVFQNSESEELIRDFRVSSNKHFNYNKDGSENIVENEANIRKNTADNYPADFKQNLDEGYSVENENPKNYALHIAKESEGSQAEQEYEKNRLESKNVNEKLSHSTSGYSGDSLFQSNGHETNGYNSALINQVVNEETNFKNKHNTKFDNVKLTKNDDYALHIERDRRQVQSLDDKTVTDIINVQKEHKNVDTTNENSILKNIKKLSEQDLEELLNSLPEDKKALLRKIMNKREITKKAGAIEDNNYLDQSDTSKIEGSFSVSSLSPATDSTETPKHDDNGEETSSKFFYSESDSDKPASKSGDNDETSTIIGKTNINGDANHDTNNQENVKNENKRETNKHDITNENLLLQNSKYNDFEDKNINDYSFEKECPDNENWFEPNYNEKTLPQKRDISPDDPSDLPDSVKKLEESFPRFDSFGSDSEPLLRVKRTELHHRVKKRDLPYVASDSISYITDLENDESENVEASEFDSNIFLDNQSNYVKNNQHLYLNSNAILNRTLESDVTNQELLTVVSPNGQKDVSEANKIGLGSDTDCVLSGIEGVDDNIMFNSAIRNKRTLLRTGSTFDTNTINENVNFNVNNRTQNVVYNDLVSMPKSCIERSNNPIDAAFGSLSLDSGADVGRYKRIKRLQNVSKFNNTNDSL